MIGFSEGMSADNIVEFCPDFNVVGRYLGLRRNSNGNFAIGEIQVTVKWYVAKMSSNKTYFGQNMNR